MHDKQLSGQPVYPTVAMLLRWSRFKGVPWYGLGMHGGRLGGQWDTRDEPGALLGSFIPLGPQLVPGVRFVATWIQRGRYAVLRYLPDEGVAIGDWGSIMIHGSHRWCLRSLDGRFTCSQSGNLLYAYPPFPIKERTNGTDQ